MDGDPQAGNIIFQLAVLVILTAINAFFSGSEMAVVSVNKIKIRNLAESGNRKAKMIESLTEDSTKFLSTIQVAITLAGFASSAFAANSISQVLGAKLSELGIPYSLSISNVIITIILAYFNLVFGELVPKRIALQFSEAFSLLCVSPIWTLSKILSPFIKLLSVSTNGFLKLIGLHHDRLEQDVSEEEIKSMLETGTETGVFNDIEKEMITSIFSFDDKKVREVMVTRQDMVAVDINEPVNDYIDEILESHHNRIPVYEENIDNIVGILCMKDYVIAAKSAGSFYKLDIRKLLKKPSIATEMQKTDAVFKEMQESGEKLAIIVDEYGGVSGMLTMEDLVEEIVGDIRDEYDEEEQDIKKLSEDVYELEGGTLISDINEELHMHITSECDTLSGYMIELLDYIPKSKNLPINISDKEADYVICAMEDRVISKVKLTKKPEEPEPDNDEELL